MVSSIAMQPKQFDDLTSVICLHTDKSLYMICK